MGGNLISLTQPAVNTPTPAMQVKQVVKAGRCLKNRWFFKTLQVETTDNPSGYHYIRECLEEGKQLPLSPRRNGLPVKLIDWSCLMIREYSTRALVELMQIGKTPSGTDPVLQHAPEAFNRIEVVATMGRQEMQPKLLVPVGQRRRELFRPVDATAVGDHDHLFAGMAKEGHHLMDILAQPLRIKMGDDLIEDFGGAILDGADDTEQHTAGDTAPGAIAAPTPGV